MAWAYLLVAFSFEKVRIIERILLVFNNIWRHQSIYFAKPFPPVEKIFFSSIFGSSKLTNALPMHMYGAYIIISSHSSLLRVVIWSTRPFLTNQISFFLRVSVDCIRARNDYYIDFEIRKIWDLGAKEPSYMTGLLRDVECMWRGRAEKK